MKLKDKWKYFRRKLRTKFLNLFGLPSAQMIAEKHTEQLCLATVNELKRIHAINIPLYPFRGAANSSLMYLLMRSVTSYDFKSVVEFGCGQSTFIFDALLKLKKNKFKMLSFENNEFWQSQVQEKVQTKVVLSPLVDTQVLGKTVPFYDFQKEIKSEVFDFILVDGPYGTKSFSRFGSVNVILNHLAEDFLIIFDDAERWGEKQSYLTLVEAMKAKGLKFHTRLLQADKHQFIIASEKFRGVCHY
tara:strand:+ start:97995 stop:98729 length:735 start_codon:yes stop_codon:yes gene_type:complete